MRLLVFATVLVLGCGSSVRETCDLAARPGSWRITTVFDHAYASPPVSCPTLDLSAVIVPTNTSEYKASVIFSPSSSELGSKEECWISYVQGSPGDAAGRTGCAGFFEAGSATRTTGSCIIDFGPPNAYGDSSSFCYYTAVWGRLN